MNEVVLFVDDQEEILDGLRRVFREEPYEILTATSAAQALEIASGVKVSVVVADQKMPGVSGIELITKIRKSSPQTMRIMLTGESSMELAIRAINDGELFRFFTKPYNAIELGLAIREAMKIRRLKEASQRLLEKSRKQTSQLLLLEKMHPGITQVDSDSTGRIALRESEHDLDSLIQELEDELIRDREQFLEEMHYFDEEVF